jgi:hypothetical protein
LWKCDKRSTERGKFIQNLWDQLKKDGYETDFAQRNHTEYDGMDEQPRSHSVRTATKIGIYGLLRGYIGEGWVKEQQKYLYSADKDGRNKSFEHCKVGSTMIFFYGPTA